MTSYKILNFIFTTLACSQSVKLARYRLPGALSELLYSQNGNDEYFFCCYTQSNTSHIVARTTSPILNRVLCCMVGESGNVVQCFKWLCRLLSSEFAKIKDTGINPVCELFTVTEGQDIQANYSDHVVLST